MEDWEKLRMDCSWRKLQGIVFRNVAGPPQVLKVVVTNARGGEICALSHLLTNNPTWYLPPTRLSDFPIGLELLSESGSVLWTESIDLRHLYFVTSDLKDVESLTGMAMLLHFQNEGYYTVESLAPLACVAARNNSQQIKISVTTLAQAREVAFSKLQADYLQYDLSRLLASRQKLSQLTSALVEVKRKIADEVPKLSLSFTKKIADHRHKKEALGQADARRRELAAYARSLLSDTSKRHELAESQLRSHWKRHQERASLAQSELRTRLETKERLTWARKTKMLAEIYSIFITQPVLEGFKLISSPLPALERDVEISTALGYSCLILESLASYLKVPLLYPLKFQGSRSSVMCEGRDMPLYALGRHTDKQRMEQSMRYLVQDIIQMLRHISFTGTFEMSQAMVLLLEQLRKDCS